MSTNNSDRFRESIDTIEPSDGAKERMLANIRKKAEVANMPVNEPQKLKTISFNKVMKWALPIAACFMLVILGATMIPNLLNSNTPAQPGEDVQIVNPFVQVENADAFSKKLGFSIEAPDGAEDVVYSIVDGNMADIYFIYHEKVYSYRASEQDGDFSGLNGITAKEEQIDAKSSAVYTAIREGDELYHKITWTDGTVTFVLSNTDGGSAEEIKELYELVK